MAEWWSIEVFSSDKLPASAWRYAYEDELTEAVITQLRYNGRARTDELLRELSGEPAPPERAEPPAEPVRIQPGPDEPVWRHIGLADRSAA